MFIQLLHLWRFFTQTPKLRPTINYAQTLSELTPRQDVYQLNTTCKDLMKVHKSFRIDSSLLNSFTNRITRKRRKKLMLNFSVVSELAYKELQRYHVQATSHFFSYPSPQVTNTCSTITKQGNVCTIEVNYPLGSVGADSLTAPSSGYCGMSRQSKHPPSVQQWDHSRLPFSVREEGRSKD